MFPPVNNSPRRYFTLLLFLLIVFASFSQSKKYPSLLWKISGKGLKKDSYLYGTMHVSKKLAYHLSDQFFDALNNAEVVGLETNPAEWMSNMDTYGMFDEQKINRSAYGGGVSNFYEDAFRINFLDNRAYGSVLSFDPDIINALLFRLTQSKENFEENTYIDLFIYQAAVKWNKSIVSLEDFKTSLLKGRLAEIPDPEIEGESSLIKKYQSYYEIFGKIEDAYRKGDLDELDSLNKVSGRTKNFQRYLLEDRNEIFVRSIDSLMAKQSVFAGVGAAHLPGRNGVIEMLRRKGYTVEPVMPKISEKNQKLKEEVEGMVKTLSFKTYFAADSLFSFSAPGRLVTIQRDVNSSFQLYPDMANGSYYSVGRCKTFAPLMNYDVAKIKQKVDSLLYENIPGKIISKKEITSKAGWPGFDIINKTKRGDLQRYHIYFTDLEMIVFKLAGREEYINSEDAKKFFSSIEFAGKNQSFINYSPPTAGFTVKFPSNLFYEHSYGSQEVGVGENLIGFDKVNQTVYGVIHAYYNDADFIEEDTFELNVLANAVLKNFNFKEADSRSFKKHQGFPGIELSAHNESQFLSARIIIKGVHYYFVYAIGLGKKPNASDFFNSFTLTDFRYVNKVKEITDENYFFRVRDELTESPSEEFEKEYQAEAAKVETVKESTKKKPYESDYKNKYYFSPSSCEHVNIEMNKINDYSFINKAEIGNFLKKPFKSASFNIVSENITEKNGLFRCEIIVNDTASVRAIKVVYIIKNGLIYTLSSPYDSNLGLRGWAKEFFETFTPMDTVIGKNVFENKFKTLAADLCSTDTAKRSDANNALLTITFDKSVTDDFVNLLNGPDFAKISSDSRAFLFVNGGGLEDDKLVAPYKKLYKLYGDSSYLQMCIIKGLAYLKTKNAYAAIVELMSSEPPLVSDDGIVSEVFAACYDSLELCKPFYPALLNLLHFQEYKVPVYKLMAELVHRKILSSSAYTDSRSGVLTEANYELKRFNSISKSAEKENPLNPSSSEYAEFIKYFWNLRKENPELFDASVRPALVDYAYILAPFYKSDENVSAFMNKLLKIKNNEVLLPACMALLENGVNVPDSLIASLVKEPEARLALYEELSRLKKTDLLAKYNIKQEQLCEGKALDFINFDARSIFKNAQAEKKSLQFLKTIKVTNNYYKGDLYVFKIVDAKSSDEYRISIFVKENKKQLSTEPVVFDNVMFYDKDKGEEAFYNGLRAKFYYLYHRRYTLNENR